MSIFPHQLSFSLLFEQFWHYLLSLSPYLLLGLLLSAPLKWFLDRPKVKKKLSEYQGMKGVFFSTLFGIPLPLCSCSVIPNAIALKKQGLSNASVSAFLVSTPETGVDSIMVTYGIMDWPLAVMRPVAAFITAIGTGAIQLLFNKNKEKVFTSSIKDHSCCATKEKSSSDDSKKDSISLKDSFFYSFGKLFDDISVGLFIGIILGAFLSLLDLSSFLGVTNPHLLRMMVLLVGIPLYICATAATPVAASFIAQGMPPGVALLFLFVGPVTNISNIIVLSQNLGKKTMSLILISVTIFSLILSYLVDFLYSFFDLPLIMKIVATHQHEVQETQVFATLSVVGLLCLFVISFYRKLKNKFLFIFLFLSLSLSLGFLESCSPKKENSLEQAEKKRTLTISINEKKEFVPDLEKKEDCTKKVVPKVERPSSINLLDQKTQAGCKVEKNKIP